MTRESNAWYTQPCYSLEQVLLLAQATNDVEALRYYDEQKKIKEKENENAKTPSNS
nr:MAG TPA: hypothetical protein [Caudoviricetes sp.]